MTEGLVLHIFTPRQTFDQKFNGNFSKAAEIWNRQEMQVCFDP